MVQALGYSETDFNPTDPGRLCRGRERWIEPWPPEEAEDASPPLLRRLVISGAQFSDDSAADALRGLPHSGVDIASVISALFPRRHLLAFTEDGHPADIPDGAEAIEAYEGYRAGGLTEVGLVRWVKRVAQPREIAEVLGDPAAEQVRGFLVLNEPPEVAELSERLFRLVGMSSLDSPPARFQPAALPDVLEVARAVILLHRDKHGPALGIYTEAPVETEGRLDALATEANALLVPFAIPPMLARWDRALAELRDEWLAHRNEEFPVPPAPEPQRWDRRRRRRKERSIQPAEE